MTKQCLLGGKMRNKRARKIREVVYGKEFSPRFRKYHNEFGGMIVADEKRRQYQMLKKEVNNG